MLFRQKPAASSPLVFAPYLRTQRTPKAGSGLCTGPSRTMDKSRLISAWQIGSFLIEETAQKHSSCNSAITGTADASRRVSTVSVKGRRISTPRQGRGRGRVTLSPTKHEQGRRWCRKPALEFLQRRRPRVCTYHNTATANRSRVSVKATAALLNQTIRSSRTRD